MARAPRIEFEGAVYHVTARGNERRRIYRSDEDRRLFLTTLEQMRVRFGMILHCFCLMPNHFHLVLETPLGNLARGMAWLQTTYTIRFNHKYRRSGHLLQGRYKAHLVEADEYAMELVRYIHLNPVRPRKKSEPIPGERTKLLEAHAWSSHLDYLGRRREPLARVATDWLGFWAGEKREARREYRKFIQVAFDQAVERPWDKLKGGLVLGSEKLWEKAKEMVGRNAAQGSVRWVNQAGLKAKRQKVAKLAAEETDERMKIWMRVELGGEKMAALGRELGYRDGSGVHRVVQRLNQRATRDKKLQNRMLQLRRETTLA
jgi:REP element-mobilizing transposase RayT